MCTSPQSTNRLLPCCTIYPQSSLWKKTFLIKNAPAVRWTSIRWRSITWLDDGWSVNLRHWSHDQLTDWAVHWPVGRTDKDGGNVGMIKGVLSRGKKINTQTQKKHTHMKPQSAERWVLENDINKRSIHPYPFLKSGNDINRGHGNWCSLCCSLGKQAAHWENILTNLTKHIQKEKKRLQIKKTQPTEENLSSDFFCEQLQRVLLLFFH